MKINIFKKIKRYLLGKRCPICKNRGDWKFDSTIFVYCKNCGTKFAISNNESLTAINKFEKKEDFGGKMK
jgi:Zn ribbon nucleic-acid-binding protein